MRKSVDQWAIAAHELVITSDLGAQSYGTFDDAGTPLGTNIQRSVRQGEADQQVCLNYDLKEAFANFLEEGDSSVIYLSNVVAGFSIKELTEKTGETAYSIRKSIDVGRSVWGTYLYKLRIRAAWE